MGKCMAFYQGKAVIPGVTLVENLCDRRKAGVRSCRRQTSEATCGRSIGGCVGKRLIIAVRAAVLGGEDIGLRKWLLYLQAPFQRLDGMEFVWVDIQRRRREVWNCRLELRESIATGKASLEC